MTAKQIKNIRAADVIFSPSPTGPRLIWGKQVLQKIVKSGQEGNAGKILLMPELTEQEIEQVRQIKAAQGN